MSTKETMSVHKALAELKVIGSRIENAIQSATFCKDNKHSNEKIAGVTIEEFKKQIQGSYDKISDLIKRRNAIKKAVVLSNAVTKVSIEDVEMTIAEAIEMKNSGISYKQILLGNMNKQYANALRNIEAQNGDVLEQKALNHIENMYGSKDVNVDPEKVKKVREEFILNNSWELIDPLKVKDKIENLNDEISKFLTEIDACLSTSNALTIIEIEY